MKLPIIIGVRRWLVVMSLLGVGASFASRPLAAWLGAPVAPVTPRVCQDSALDFNSYSRVDCRSDQRLEIVGRIVRCTCVRPGTGKGEQ